MSDQAEVALLSNDSQPTSPILPETSPVLPELPRQQSIKVGAIKKNLILTVVMFVMLAIGIGVGRVFSQTEDAKSSLAEETKPHAKVAESHVAKTEHPKVESQNKPKEIPQPPTIVQPVSQISDATKPALPQGKGMASLLYPERTQLQENAITEDGIFGLYAELQSEAQGSNAAAIERHAELRSVLAKYLESRKASQSEAAIASQNSEPAK